MAKTEKSDWLKIKPQEHEKLVLDLSKETTSPAKIGLALRDKHGIPKSKLIGKKVSQILKDNKIAPKTDIESIKEKIQSVEKHISANKHDNTAKRALTKQLWALNRLNKQAE